jgi:hypothetical protein
MTELLVRDGHLTEKIVFTGPAVYQGEAEADPAVAVLPAKTLRKYIAVVEAVSAASGIVTDRPKWHDAMQSWVRSAAPAKGMLLISNDEYNTLANKHSNLRSDLNDWYSELRADMNVPGSPYDMSDEEMIGYLKAHVATYMSKKQPPQGDAETLLIGMPHLLDLAAQLGIENPAAAAKHLFEQIINMTAHLRKRLDDCKAASDEVDRTWKEVRRHLRDIDGDLRPHDPLYAASVDHPDEAQGIFVDYVLQEVARAVRRLLQDLADVKHAAEIGARERTAFEVALRVATADLKEARGDVLQDLNNMITEIETVLEVREPLRPHAEQEPGAQQTAPPQAVELQVTTASYYPGDRCPRCPGTLVRTVASDGVSAGVYVECDSCHHAYTIAPGYEPPQAPRALPIED